MESKLKEMVMRGKIYDISLVLGQQNTTFPGDIPFQLKKETGFTKGDNYNVSSLSMSAHSGTHLDIPYHYFDDKKTLEKIPAEEFILPAVVIETDDTPSVTDETLKQYKITEGSALLFKTANTVSGLNGSGDFKPDFVYISTAAAELCVEKKVGLIGIDFLSVDNFHSETYPVHKTLMRNDILILENIYLKDVPAGEYTLICLPLKIYGSEASPVRAVLLEE